MPVAGGRCPWLLELL